MIRSIPVGAGLGALSIVASTLAAIWVSGLFQTFADNRGLLQLLVAIPLASLVTGGCLAYTRILTSVQVSWGMLPVGCLILFGIGAFGPGYAAWPWALAIGAAVFVPWVIGMLIGSAAGRRYRSGA